MISKFYVAGFDKQYIGSNLVSDFKNVIFEKIQ